MIRKGMSKELEKKIQEVRGSIRVKKIHDENFSAGGFNPRPMKLKGFYLLGTLSDHATGMAVDIDDSKNAQLTAADWKFVEKLVGTTVPRGKDRWETEDDAEDFWSDVTDLSDGFVAKVASEIERITKERAEKERKEKEEKEKEEKEKASAKPAVGHKDKEKPAKACGHPSQETRESANAPCRRFSVTTIEISLPGPVPDSFIFLLSWFWNCTRMASLGVPSSRILTCITFNLTNGGQRV